MRPDASENSQISPSTIVRAARAAGSHPHLASVLLQGRKKREYSRQFGSHPGNNPGLFTIVYDGDFKPYVEDILREASPWLDQIFLGVWDGFKGTKDRKSVEELLGAAFECDLFFVRNPDVTVRDVAKMKRLSAAVNELLDAAT